MVSLEFYKSGNTWDYYFGYLQYFLNAGKDVE